MSELYDAIEVALQILFGILGIAFAIAAIHYRDSICSVLLRRYRQRPIEYHELEAGTLYPNFEHRTAEVGSPYRTLSLPPTYDPHDIGKIDTVYMEGIWRAKFNVEGHTQGRTSSMPYGVVVTASTRTSERMARSEQL